MKVLYEPTTFSIQDFGGVSRYFHELLNHAGPGLSCQLPVVLSNNLYLRDRQHTDHFEFFPRLAIPGSWRLMYHLNRRATLQALRRQNFDVLHPTTNDQTYFLDLLGDKPLVITIHDMIPALFGQHYQQPATALEVLARRADRIITVSENTRADVLRLLDVPAERVSVVHHGHSVRDYPAGPALRVPAHYVLFVGNRRAYKNFACLVEAFGQLVRHGFGELRLVCAGGGPFTPEEQELLHGAGIGQRTQQFSAVSDAQLAGLYRGAQAFVFPSRYEGFGFPILEAFGQRCPVLLSDTSCFPEIAQDAGLYFDPNDPAELQNQLERLLRDQELRHTLVQRGVARVADFTWPRAATRTRQVYEEARQTVPAYSL
ncbi:Glycosyltransferase involved in cell wall bisynthesis [Hymenobacter daecheongensis DSM 21074]|uniref:Glycosyltransferase involved in cell wall bisynthesis n=1 Tax=Hymenobacter daecheongensis DSM 21074 TaxID=1121955 RepID=A0A1M6KJ46_9BACT|nr:glycosyltransferase family 1 protein [Hymenobacter daecheongensis]SHJ59002.1 Glycosyltransferase involved in cell wall bisynthesis [Hymenobacter daecheongensis DSM 21074]